MIKRIIEIIKYPKISIHCDLKTDRQKEVYSYFTKLHPKYRIIRNKSLGVALINLSKHSDYEAYYKSINGKNSAAYESRKAIRRGYKFKSFDPSKDIKGIVCINKSSSLRQGREMGQWYQSDNPGFLKSKSINYFGVFSEEGDLVSYCMTDSLGNTVNFSKLLGHADHLKHGVMYLMLVEYIKMMFEDKHVQYVMYDTMTGASSGLRFFKNKLGFKGYNVTWKKNIS